MAKKKKSGRPSKLGALLTPEGLEKVRELGKLGLIDKEIALTLGIAESSLYLYKKNRRFSEALKKGKIEADKLVVASAFKRATGFEYEETESRYKIVRDPRTGEQRPELQSVKKVKRIVPADVTAIALWLNNRQADRFRRRDFGQTVIAEEDDDANVLRIKIVKAADNEKPRPKDQDGNSR